MSSPKAEYIDRLASITARLDGLRVPQRLELRSARTAQKRRAAALRLRDAFREALGAARDLQARPGSEVTHRRVLNALDRAADGYASMARAAPQSGVVSFNQAADRVARAERALRLALGVLTQMAADRVAGR